MSVLQAMAWHATMYEITRPPCKPQQALAHQAQQISTQLQISRKNVGVGKSMLVQCQLHLEVIQMFIYCKAIQTWILQNASVLPNMASGRDGYASSDGAKDTASFAQSRGRHSQAA